MKRKRGRRPGKKSAAAPASASPAESPSSPSTEEASTPEDQAEEDAPVAAAPAVPEPPPPPPPVSPPSQPPSQRPPDITYTKPKVGAVYGRVKLKFKKPAPVEPPAPQQQLSASAPPADAAKPGKSAVPEAVTEASAEKVAVVVTDRQQADVQASEMSSGGSDKEKVVRKVGIKIKSTGLSSSSAAAAAVEGSTPDRKPDAEDDRKAEVPPPSNLENASENKETQDTEEPRSSQESEKNQSTPEQRRRDDKELAAALEAIKKVMKMDAAEPFNTPVDPVALGIPDYFDIIDTPMDFGTICQNLEHGNKYMNSEDVYRDVQFIWDNCTKYNSKGDYVVELMKRVKKGFMKHWLAAGLYSDAPESGGNDNTGDEDAKKSKSKNKRRRPGNDRHKNDCACAVCQVTRRKKEKDEMAAIDNEITIMDSNTLDQHNLEGNSGANHPGSHDTSSQEQPTQADMYKEAAEANDSDIQMEDRPSSLLHSGGEDEGSRQYSDRKEGIEYIDKNQEEHTPSKPYEYSGAEHHQKEQIESSPEVEMEDYPVQQENPAFTKLCASLFPRVRRYAFRGRHSLFRPQRRVPLKEGPLHAAIAAIMKP